MIDRELKDITKKSGIVFIGKIISTIIGFFFSLMAARFMGAEVYGKLTYTFTIIILLSVFTRLGLTQGLVQFVSKLTEQNKEERNSLVTFSIFIVTLISIIFTFFLYKYSNYVAVNILNNKDLSILIKIMSPLIIFLSLNGLSTGIYRGIKTIRYNVFGSILFSSIKLLLVIIFGYMGFKIYGLALTYHISIIITVIYLYYKIKKLKLIGKISKTYFSSYIDILKFSYPLLMSGLLHFFINKIDIFMIGYYLSSTDVGVYTIALKVGTLTSFVLFSFNTIFAPNIASLYHNEKMSKLKKLYQVITKWIFAINIFVFSLILLLSKDIMTVFGPEFIIGATALILVAIGQVVNAGVGTAGSVNVMTGYPKSELYISIVVFVINISLNYILIPIYGINGAAIASLISVAVMNFMRLYILYKRLDFLPYTKDYLKNIYSTIISFTICYILVPHINTHYFLRLLIIGSIFTVINIISNYYFGFSKEDKLIFKSVLNKIKNI
ncbi:MAG: flippase [Halanaerobiales bacterium]|nr:flippase [Halanaerobiales bacterium]